MSIAGTTRTQSVPSADAQALRIHRKTVKFDFKNYEGKDVRIIMGMGPNFDRTFKLKPNEQLIIEVPLMLGDSILSEGTEAFRKRTGVNIRWNTQDIPGVGANATDKPVRKWVFTVELDANAAKGKHAFRIDAGSRSMPVNVPAYFNFEVQ